jgi:hypothetical protein
MRIASVLVGLALALCVSLGSSQALAQEAPRVNNVLFFDTGGDLAKFQGFFGRAQAIAKQHGGTGTSRLWVATYAGPNTNMVVVVTEYPNLVSMAESAQKVGSTKEWQQLVADVQAAGMRIVSNSVTVEATP